MEKISDFLRMIRILQEDDSPIALFQDNHIKIMPYVWTFVINISVFFAMYKFRAFNIYIHAVIALFVSLVTLITSFPILIEEGIPDEEDDSYQQRHFIIGLIVMIIILLQILLGVVSKILQLIPWSHPYLIYFLNIGHKYLGYSVMVLAKIQVFLILNLQDDQQALFWGLLASEIVLFILWVISKLFFPKMQGTTVPEVGPSSLMSVKSISDFNSVGPKAVFANYVYDIDPLQHHHPNGYLIVQKINGRELDRFLYGMYENENFPLIPPNSHGFKSLSLLDNPIGVISIPPLYSGHSKSYDEVSLAHISHISQKGSIYEVRLTNRAQQFSFQHYTTPEQLGRFYALTLDNKVTRLYTSVSFLDPSNLDLLRTLLPGVEYLYKPSYSDAKGHQSERQLQELRNYIPFLVKLYPSGSLTPKLIGRAFRQLHLSEPRGQGLKLSSTEAGKIIVVAGGTGLYPFSDIIDLLFKNSFTNSDPQTQQIIFGINPILKKFSFKSFNFHLFLAVQSLEDIHPITLNQIMHLCKKTTTFKLTLRVSEVSNLFKEKNPFISFTQEYFDRIITKQVSAQPYSKIWICGPPKMTESILCQFKESNIPEQKVLIL